MSVRAQFFDVVDADHSGEIDVHELQRALALGDLNFSLSIVAHMIRWGCLAQYVPCVLDAYARSSL